MTDEHFTLLRIEATDNLEGLVADINHAAWDEDNDLVAFDVKSLQSYLKREDTVFLVCYDTQSKPPTLLGMASARIEIKPYRQEQWLYVDEVDVCADQRQRGAGKQIMRALFSIADEHNCEEVWLGTETDNDAANALYTSLGPEEVEAFVGYTFDPDDFQATS